MQHKDNKTCKMEIAFHTNIVLGPKTWTVEVRGEGEGNRFKKKKPVVTF